MDFESIVKPYYDFGEIKSLVDLFLSLQKL